MPLTKTGKPILNKPFRGKSTPSKKKFSVYVKAATKKGYKIIHFGAKGMDDWRSGTATKEQRKSFRGNGLKVLKERMVVLHTKIKVAPAYWALNYLMVSLKFEYKVKSIINNK